MLPRLKPQEQLQTSYQAFINALQQSSFQGESSATYSDRITYATDNSIYQILPQAVVFPKNHDDVLKLFQLAQQPEFQEIAFSPRGGGTGTNGQSLTDGIVIDMSRHMNQILDINIEQGSARIQPGVVLDQLNDSLKQYNLCFAPTLSPSSRATIGGMFNTDASGKGSLVYGKTSEHILATTSVLCNAEVLHIKSMNADNLAMLQTENSLSYDIHNTIKNLIDANQEEITKRFPKLIRFLTGYNLAKFYDQTEQQYNLNYILAGSEGTLAAVTELTVKLTPLPKARKLLVLHYSSFTEALADAKELIAAKPSAVESVDDHLVKLAKDDIIYNDICNFIESSNGQATKAINFVEFIGDNTDDVSKKVQALSQKVANSLKAHDFSIAEQERDINNLWLFRKKSVGLLGAMGDKRHPVAFVEDTVVPPENLAAYIAEFRALLEKHQLSYGMFGHVDVGCLHVRPALDLTNPEDEKLIVTISEGVVALLQKYNGVIWGEHGKGFRSCYVETFFGPQLYKVLRQVKALFDPHNRLNPGKLVTAADTTATVVPLTSPLRGHFDRQVPESVRQHYAKSFTCNGNGACFNYSAQDVMCPSYKVTKDRIHSPKGRATLMREWLRQLAVKNISLDNIEKPQNIFRRLAHGVFRRSGQYDFSHEVYDAMQGCLGCNACATQCPIHVTIPNLRSRFLAQYYSRYPRKIRDYIFAHSEYSARWLSHTTKLHNALMSSRVIKWCLLKMLGIYDPPLLTQPELSSELKSQTDSSLAALNKLTNTEKQRSIIIVTDPFLGYYEANIILTCIKFLQQHAFNVVTLPIRPNGKALHVNGYLLAFKKLVNKNMHYYRDIAKHNMPMIGLEASAALSFRDEYRAFCDQDDLGFHVELIQEWLSQNLQLFPQTDLQKNNSRKPYYLFTHCTEKSLVADSAKQWQAIFQHFGLQLEIMNSGCCGMAGTYGHEKEHYVNSKKLYAMSWQNPIENGDISPQQIIATGFSCRAQVKRFSGFNIRHPIEVLLVFKNLV